MMTFKTGRSGNPSGRPKGVKDRRSVFRELIEPSHPSLAKKAITMALDGNEQMLKLLLDRLLPPKPREEPINIGLTFDNLAETSRTIMKELADGKITVSEAEALMRTIYLESKIYEAEILKKQVEELMKLAGKS